MRSQRHINGQQHHDAPGDLGEFVHQGSGRFTGKDEDGNGGTDERSGNGADPEEHVQSQPRTAYVSDVEGQAPGADQGRNHIAQAWQDHVGDVLPRPPGHGDDAPGIQLGDGIDDDHGQDGKAKVSPLLGGKYNGLCQETRSNSGSGHQEGRSQQYTECRFFLHENVSLSISCLP